jgi:serine protease inhibitor
MAAAMAFGNLSLFAQSGPDGVDRRLVSANSGFGFRLLRELAREQPRANIFVSPYSISSLLQMLGVGARGQTATELEAVLGTGAFDRDARNEGYLRLGQTLSQVQTNARLDIASALWYRTGAALDPGFAAVNEKFYRATVQGLDFRDPSSADLMNRWAADQTQGRITQIIQPPLPLDSALVLANAIYFKGTWLDQFDPKQTRPRPFHRPDGGDKDVPMMQLTRKFSYQQGKSFQSVELPYVGRRLRMHVILPAPQSSLDALVGQLSADFWQSILLPAYRENRGTLVLPRFTLRYGAELKPALLALGLKNAWTAEADFSGVSNARLFLSEVKHQSFVEVNELGTEAAAVTTGVMALASFQNPAPPFEMTVDRPFLCAISDQLTGSILFLGAIFDPGV